MVLSQSTKTVKRASADAGARVVIFLPNFTVIVQCAEPVIAQEYSNNSRQSRCCRPSMMNGSENRQDRDGLNFEG